MYVVCAWSLTDENNSDMHIYTKYVLILSKFLIICLKKFLSNQYLYGIIFILIFVVDCTLFIVADILWSFSISTFFRFIASNTINDMWHTLQYNSCRPIANSVSDKNELAIAWSHMDSQSNAQQTLHNVHVQSFIPPKCIFNCLWILTWMRFAFVLLLSDLAIATANYWLNDLVNYLARTFYPFFLFDS